MRYKFPLQIPLGRRVSVTQGFKSTELVNEYKKAGINITSHEAIDAIAGNPAETYGTPFVCPFPSATLYAFQPEANPTAGARIRLSHKDTNGDILIMGGLHLFDLVEKQVYLQGDILGYVGNYGYVLPKPTIGAPFAGSHIHLELWKNGTPVDPLLYFDPQNPFIGKDTGIEKDAGRIRWAIQKIKEALGMG